MDQNKGGLVTYFFPLSFSILFMFERIIATQKSGVSDECEHFVSFQPAVIRT